jgi:hypothetical protein
VGSRVSGDIGVVMVISWAWTILDDKAWKPVRSQACGLGGSDYLCYWRRWRNFQSRLGSVATGTRQREKVTGVIKPDPIPYHLNLDALDALDASYSVSEWYQKAPGSSPGASAVPSIRLR